MVATFTSMAKNRDRMVRLGASPRNLGTWCGRWQGEASADWSTQSWSAISLRLSTQWTKKSF